MTKKIISVSVLSIVFLSAFTFLSGSLWKVKEAAVKISFDVPADPHQMSFSEIKADINFDSNDLKSSEFVARINVKSLQTEDPGLTKHLLSPDFLDAEKFPEIKFISTRIQRSTDANIFIAHGVLAMKDSAHVVDIPFTFTEKEGEGLFKGNFSIFSGDYGVMKKSKSGSDKVIIAMDIPVTQTKGQ